MVLVDISQENLSRLADSLNKTHGEGKAHPFKCDITNFKELEALSKRVIETVGHPTMVINNAGILAGKYFLDMSLDEVHRTFSVNTFAHYYTVKLFLPRMLEQNHGHIVSVSSILGMDSVAGVAEYGPSKSAATAFMHAMRQEIRLLGRSDFFSIGLNKFYRRKISKDYPHRPTNFLDNLSDFRKILFSINFHNEDKLFKNHSDPRRLLCTPNKKEQIVTVI